MSRKDFILIAGALAEARRLSDFALSSDPAINRIERTACMDFHDRTVREVADVLATTNSQFKRDLFIQAATGVVPVTARKARV